MLLNNVSSTVNSGEPLLQEPDINRENIYCIYVMYYTVTVEQKAKNTWQDKGAVVSWVQLWGGVGRFIKLQSVYLNTKTM